MIRFSKKDKFAQSIPSRSFARTLVRCGGAPIPELSSRHCYDASRAAALGAYARAIASPKFLEGLPIDSAGQPHLANGRPIIGQALTIGGWDGDPATYVCGERTLNSFEYLAERMEQHRKLTGKRVGIIKEFAFYSWNGQMIGLPKTKLDTIHQRGAVPFLADSPTDVGTEPNKVISYSMSDIVAGKYDEQIRQRGKAISDLGYYILYSWGHEMNGSWYPYGRSDLGNTPELFAAAMRHVYNLYQAVGATNILWVYSPAVWDPYNCGLSKNPADCPLESVDRYYPYPQAGETDFISLIAPHLYNWGTGDYYFGKGVNKSFDQLGRETFALLNQRHPDKLFGVGEMGCSSDGVDINKWLSEAFAKMLEWPYNLSMFVYFNPPGNDAESQTRWPNNSNLF